MLLRVKNKSAEGDRSSFKVVLSEYGGSGVYFKITSKYKIRQDGDKIVTGDRVVVESSKMK